MMCIFVRSADNPVEAMWDGYGLVVPGPAKPVASTSCTCNEQRNNCFLGETPALYYK